MAEDKLRNIKSQYGRSKERELYGLLGKNVRVDGTIIFQRSKIDRQGNRFLQVTLQPAYINKSIKLDHINLFIYKPDIKPWLVLNGCDFSCISTVNRYKSVNRLTNTVYYNYGVNQVKYKYWADAILNHKDPNEKKIKSIGKLGYLTSIDKIKIGLNNFERSLSKILCKNTTFVTFNQKELNKIAEILPTHKDKKKPTTQITVNSKRHNFSMADLLKDIDGWEMVQEEDE